MPKGSRRPKYACNNIWNSSYADVYHIWNLKYEKSGPLLYFTSKSAFGNTII